MRVKLTAPNSRDQHYLIDVNKFMGIVDNHDLSLRKSVEIIDSYHVHWFPNVEEDLYEFFPPVFFLRKGLAKFINGRHRTLLLCRHMKIIPMALANMDGYPTFSKNPHPLSQTTLGNIAISALEGNEIIEFPNLTIKYLGYDDNIGK